MVKKLWEYIKPFLSNTGTSRTDGRIELLYQYRASVCWRAIKIKWNQTNKQTKILAHCWNDQYHVEIFSGSPRVRLRHHRLNVNHSPRSQLTDIHSFVAICRAHYVENVESEALEAVARWSVIGKIVSFQIVLKAVEWMGLSGPKCCAITDVRGTVGKTGLFEAAMLQYATENTFWLTERRDCWGWWGICIRLWDL